MDQTIKYEPMVQISLFVVISQLMGHLAEEYMYFY